VVVCGVVARCGVVACGVVGVECVTHFLHLQQHIIDPNKIIIAKIEPIKIKIKSRDMFNRLNKQI
jgi:hypothetical protein